MNEALLQELAAAGFEVASVSELRTSGLRYAQAVPALLRGLSRSESLEEREEIVRALSVPWARKQALVPLIEEFQSIELRDDGQLELLRWAVGNALEVLFDDGSFEALAELARDKRYGKARQMIVIGLGKSKRPEAVQVLLSLLDDPDVDGQAVKALGKLKAPAARVALEGKLADRRGWVRSEARKALAKLS